LNNVFQVNYKNNGNTITECYIYIGFYGGTLSTYPTTLVPAGSNVILSQTDYFSQLNLVSPGIPNIWFTSCNQCSSYRP
jgi:hypothetical protein